MVEHSAVNRRVASSNLARGAKFTVYPALHHALTATASNGAFSGFRPFRPITRILAGISKPSPALSAHSLRSPRSAATLSYRSDMVSPARKGAHVIGYMESDYLGTNPTNVGVSSNSNTLRSRLYWVDVQKDKWELLAGQTWSLITPGRMGISPLPGNFFFTRDIDVNYQAGLVSGRIPELRLVLCPTNKVAF